MGLKIKCSQGWFWLVLLGALFATGCVRTPVTGRRVMILLPVETELKLGADGYKEILSKEKVSKDVQVNQVVRSLGRRIADVSGRPNWPWEFTVLDAPDTLNAFALPGGKVAVYTGLLKVAKNEAALAAVMGHEVAHAIARHGAQRVSQSLLINLGLAVADISLDNAEHKELILGGLGAGAALGVILPYGRGMESEADEIGLLFMAQAGYDPREAIAFWERFKKATGSKGSPPEFLSTHPATRRRIADLKRALPKALVEYEKSARRGLGRQVAVPSAS